MGLCRWSAQLFHCELDTFTVIVRGTDGLRKDLNFTLAIP
jgi:hypothetical protein